MQLPSDVMFCCLALKGPRLQVQGLHTLLPGLIVSDSQTTIDLDETWIKWLGSLQARSFRESSLFITAQEKFLFHGRDAAVRLKLEHRVKLLHKALIILGCGYNSDVLMVGGNMSGGHLHIGPVTSRLMPSHRPDFRAPREISISALAKAKTILTSLEHVYQNASQSPYRRIRKGFNLWIRGTEECWDLNERLHFFVRAVEAIIRPTIAKRRRPRSKKAPWRAVTSTFKLRGRTFIGLSDQSDRLLQELYEIRSSIEHIQDIVPKVRKLRNRSIEETFCFRALQCEILASTIYSRIFTNDALREQLKTERRVEGFWRRNETNRQALWGRAIDLNAAAKHEFRNV